MSALIVLACLFSWLMISLPVGVLIGKWFKRINGDEYDGQH